MTDTLFIRDLQVECLIGRADWERMVRQTVHIDLKVPCDVRHAAAQDDVGAGVVNTKALSKRIIGWVGESRYQLIETLAEHLAALVLAEFSFSWVELRVSKPGALRGARTVGVRIRRSREE